MIIKSLHIENFRCFQQFDIDLDKRLTVIVGVNGAGKTSVLDAAAVFLEAFTKSMTLTDKSYCFPALFSKDIAVGGRDKIIKYQITLDYKSEATQTSDNISHKAVYFEFEQNIPTRADLKIIKGFGDFSDFVTEFRDKPHTNCYGLPIACYYNSSRQIETKTTYKTQSQNAYEKSFEPQIDFSATLSWFIEKDADEARRQRKDQSYTDPELKAIREAVVKVLGNYDEPFVEGTPPKLYISPKNRSDAYTVAQLSDGYRIMLALVMDLARRMAVANGNLPFFQKASVLNSPAIVLIEEIELHLHPVWQQTVLPTLLEIFPRTQFVVTTQSDQVLTSIPSKHIMILNDRQLAHSPEEFEGAESARVLKRIFQVDSRPPNNVYVKKLNKYAELVCADQWDSDEAMKLRNKLEQHFGIGSEPYLKELELHIENRKWEKSL
jgi:predicted ATP-binding protein involved in virulence